MTSKRQSTETKLEVLCAKVDAMKEDVTEIKHKLEQNYITKDQFDPVKKIVYGMVGLILVAVVAAILRFVVVQ